MPFAEVLNIADKLTVVALLVSLLFALSKGFLYLPREVKSRDRTIALLELEAKEWKTLALRATEVGEKSKQIIEGEK